MDFSKANSVLGKVDFINMGPEFRSSKESRTVNNNNGAGN
jgi:hypothetical protein